MGNAAIDQPGKVKSHITVPLKGSIIFAVGKDIERFMSHYHLGPVSISITLRYHCNRLIWGQRLREGKKKQATNTDFI